MLRAKGVSPLQLVIHRTSSVSPRLRDLDETKLYLPFPFNEPRGFHNSLRSRPEANSRSVGAMPHELPAFLKARLKARGIKVDDEANNRGGSAENPNEDSSLPAGWTETVDEKYGHAYYYNASLGKSSWTRPTNGDAHIIGVMVANPAPKTLPPGWKSAIDPKTNRTYYCDASTKVTTWEPPLPLQQKQHMKRTVVIVPADNTVSARAAPVAPVATNRKRQRAAPPGIDPMDPASYSDAPVGGWGAGLASQKESEGGSSGRPLPSPGDVLRQNAQSQQPTEPYDLQKSGLGEAD